MDPLDVGKFWNSNAPGWIEMLRSGCDVYRDKLNAPAFLTLLPCVDGMSGLDIGCGEGCSTRQIADLGASLTGIDLSEKFIEAAAESEKLNPRGIKYTKASALSLPFDDATFNFATAFMSLMDMPSPDRVLGEAHRVIKPGGFLQFSISHPCFELPYRKNKRDGKQLTYAFELGGYFEPHNGYVAEWTFNNAPVEMREKHDKFKVPRFSLTMSEWKNLLIDSHFTIERLSEPRPSQQAIEECPRLQDASIVAYFLHVRARKVNRP